MFILAGWHHRLDGREFEWTPGVGDGQGGLACCDLWGHKESDMTEWLNWTELNVHFPISSHRTASSTGTQSASKIPQVTYYQNVCPCRTWVSRHQHAISVSCCLLYDAIVLMFFKTIFPSLYYLGWEMLITITNNPQNSVSWPNKIFLADTTVQCGLAEVLHTRQLFRDQAPSVWDSNIRLLGPHTPSLSPLPLGTYKREGLK